MISKSQISFVKSLHQKKYRKENGLFIAEGIKSINEFLRSDYLIHTIFATSDAVSKLDKLSQKVKPVQVTEQELQKISTLSTAQHALALISTPNKTQIQPESFINNFSLVLDGVQDPGNLGTIIRTADWFGITNIICSHDTVEAYNPKVVQATMGSLSRMNIYYADVQQFLNEIKLPVFGAFLEGNSIYKTDFGTQGFIILGNEGNGISKDIEALIDHRVTIPAFGKAESLNVAISAAIFCSEIRANR